MSTLQAQVSDRLLQQVRELADKEHVSVDQVVATALEAQVSSWRKRLTIAERAKRVDWEKVDEILARVPDVRAMQGDEL